MHRQLYYLAGLIGAVGVLLMIIAGINAGVNPIGGPSCSNCAAYWPWSQCTGNTVPPDVGTFDPTEGPNACNPNGNANGIYITEILFIGLGLFVLAGMCAAFLVWGLGISLRSLGAGGGLVGAETGTALRTTGRVTRDSLRLRPFKATSDAVRGGMKMGVKEPLSATKETLGGMRHGGKHGKHGKKHHY